MENYHYLAGEPVLAPFAGQISIGTFVALNADGYLVRFRVGTPDCEDIYYKAGDINPMFAPGDVVNLIDSGQGAIMGTHPNGAYLVNIFSLDTVLSVSFQSVLYAAFPVLDRMKPQLEQLYREMLVEEEKANAAKVDYPEGSWPERETQQYFLGLFAGRVDSLARALHCMGYEPDAVSHIRRDTTKKHLQAQKQQK